MTSIEGRIFLDRRAAGRDVGRILERDCKGKNALVLGIPRGGVPVAFEIANIIHGELSVLITKKLPHPNQSELAIGATAEDGSTYLTSYSGDLDQGAIRSILIAQQKEIHSRIDRFRGGKPLPPMQNRIVIIADDGIATGSTIVPAIKLCKSRKAAKVIVAVPVSGHNYVSDVNSMADEVVIAEKCDNLFAVGQVYKDFHPLSDKEVTQLLKDFEQHL